MTVIVMDGAPESVRGELKRWFLELKPGVFVGRVNVRIRELLWERICSTDRAAGAVMAFSAPTEQGFEMRVQGDPKRRVTDFDGIQLVTVSNQNDTGEDDNDDGGELLRFSLERNLLDE